jgi:hypothetical protein
MNSNSEINLADEKQQQQNNNNNNNFSMFNDIKEVLKQAEYSKSKIESDLLDNVRIKNNKTFYILSSTEPNKRTENLRLKKLVDECMNAISNDVKVRRINLN